MLDMDMVNMGMVDMGMAEMDHLAGLFKTFC